MNSSAKKPLLCALLGEKQAFPPIWIMRQAGRYLPEYRALRAKAGSFMTLCLTPDYALEASLQPIRRYELDGAILFSDILMVPYGLGSKVAFLEGEGPSLSPVRKQSDLDRLDTEMFNVRVAPIYETLRRLRNCLPASIALLGFAGAPWTVAAYMVEGHGSKDWLETKRLAFQEPNFFAQLIELLTETTIEYLSRQIDAGADAVQIFDSWAGCLAERDFFNWVVEPQKRIVAALKQRYPRTPVIAFPRGAGLMLETFAREVDPFALGLDTTVPAAWAARQLQPRWCLQGNLDPIRLLGSRQSLFEETRHLLESFNQGPYIFNLGHGILQQTEPERLQELIAFIRGFEFK